MDPNKNKMSRSKTADGGKGSISMTRNYDDWKFLVPTERESSESCFDSYLSVLNENDNDERELCAKEANIGSWRNNEIDNKAKSNEAEMRDWRLDEAKKANAIKETEVSQRSHQFHRISEENRAPDLMPPPTLIPFSKTFTTAVRDQLTTHTQNLEPPIAKMAELNRRAPKSILRADQPEFVPRSDGSNIFGPRRPPGMSAELFEFTQFGYRKPTAQEALSARHLPFIEHCRSVQPSRFGVVKISNIPYSISRGEVLAFLGRSAKLVNENDGNEPVHIIMEKVTSKTLDCFVEFIDMNAASETVQRIENNRYQGRLPRLGSRYVEIELSSQGELMKQLFPKAKNMDWTGKRPMVIPRDPADQYNSGFQGFVSSEEWVMLLKWVETPQRSPFARDCPERVYECLISTLLKYPWYMVDNITVGDYRKIFDVIMAVSQVLVRRTQREEFPGRLTSMLFKRFWKAAVACPGLSYWMKDSVFWKCGIDDLMRENGVSPWAAHFHFWTISPKPGVPEDLWMYYAAKIREHASAMDSDKSLADRAATDDRIAENEGKSVFGKITAPLYVGEESEINKTTLAERARQEWALLEEGIRNAFDRGGNRMYYSGSASPFPSNN